MTKNHQLKFQIVEALTASNYKKSVLKRVARYLRQAWKFDERYGPPVIERLLISAVGALVVALSVVSALVELGYIPFPFAFSSFVQLWTIGTAGVYVMWITNFGKGITKIPALVKSARARMHRDDELHLELEKGVPERPEELTAYVVTELRSRVEYHQNTAVGGSSRVALLKAELEEIIKRLQSSAEYFQSRSLAEDLERAQEVLEDANRAIMNLKHQEVQLHRFFHRCSERIDEIAAELETALHREEVDVLSGRVSTLEIQVGTAAIDTAGDYLSSIKEISQCMGSVGQQLTNLPICLQGDEIRRLSTLSTFELEFENVD